MAYEMPEEVAAKVKAGHTPVYDGGRVERWTCTDRECGAAVLRYGNNIYGTATELTCDENKARWAESARLRSGGA
jgi:hypothetical protein